MNIGFDLDKILIDYPPFIPSSLIDRLYKQKSDGTLLYRIPSKLEQLLRLFTHYPIFRPAISENLDFVRSLPRQENNKYYLISSRFSFLKGRTEKLVKKYNFDQIFDAMFFNFGDEQPHIFKNKIVQKLKLDRYVDDDLALLKFLSAQNPKIKFFWLNQKSDRSLTANLWTITRLSKVME